MSATVLHFKRHGRSFRRTAEFGKEIVRRDAAAGNVFDFCSQVPRGSIETTTDATNGGSVATQECGHCLVSEIPFGHPVSELHGNKSALGARACQAHGASSSLDSLSDRAQDAQMPIRALKQTSQPKPQADNEKTRLWHPLLLAPWRQKRHGMSQEELADRIGKDRTIVTKLEGGKIGYTQGNLEACARVLQCEPWQLLVHDPSDPTWPYRLFNSLDPESRRQLIKIAKDFKE